MSYSQRMVHSGGKRRIYFLKFNSVFIHGRANVVKLKTDQTKHPNAAKEINSMTVKIRQHQIEASAIKV